MNVLHKEDVTKGQFYIEKEGKLLAEMTYVWAGDRRIIIDHTDVHDELRGTGAGKQLVAKAVDFARAENIKILPLCPFAKSVINKTKEYHDIL